MKGKSIASPAELDFLFAKLKFVVKNPLVSYGGHVTKDSVKDINILYDEKIYTVFNAAPGNGAVNSRLKLATPETVASIFKKKEATADNSSINKLAALVLLVEKEINYDQCIQQILSNSSWQYFKAIYSLRETYLLYYWRGNHVNIAQVSLQLNETKTEWVDCRMLYYDYNKTDGRFTACTSPHTVVIIPKTTDTSKNTFSFYVYYHYQVTQVTISIPSDKKKQNLFFCSYVSHNQHGHLFSGIGLLKKYSDIFHKIDEINTSQKIDDDIYNILHEKANDIFYDAFDSDGLPNAGEMDALKKISGVWTAWYLRGQKPNSLKSTGTGMGGLEKSFLMIDTDGRVHFKTDESGQAGYTGFLNYPIADNKTSIKIKTNAVQSKSKNYRINMFLNLDVEQQVLQGIISGWSGKGRPFSSLIRMERYASLEKAALYFNEAVPSFIQKKDIQVLNLSNELIDFLQNERKFFDDAEHSLPFFTTGKRDYLKRLAGSYYVLSRDYQEAMLDKAKLIILETGAFNLYYPDVSYKGNIREFVSTNLTDKYIYLNITSKKSNHPNSWSDFAGALLFNIPNKLFDKPGSLLYRDAKAVIGLSLRKNAQGAVQCKKEIIIPAENLLLFNKEQPEKYTYTQENALRKNLKVFDNKGSADLFNYRAVIRDLKGKEDNIIQLPLQNNIFKPIRETDYFEVYMNAFFFEAIFSNYIDYPKLYNYLFQSLLHLDNKTELTNKLKAIANTKSMAAGLSIECFKEIEALYDALLAMGNDGQLSEFLETLKSPAYVQRSSPLIIVANKIVDYIRNKV